jgi:hypothetical protein
MLIDIGLAHYKLFLRWGITRFSIQGVLDGEKIATTKRLLGFQTLNFSCFACYLNLNLAALFFIKPESVWSSSMGMIFFSPSIL